MSTELEDLLEKISKTLDVYEFLDLMGWNMHDLVHYCKDEININSHIFEDALN